MGSILSDSTTVSANAIGNCSVFFSSLVSGYVSLAGDDKIIAIVVKALSSILGKSNTFSSNTLQNLTGTIDALASSHLTYLAVGSAGTTLVYDNLRFLALSKYASDIANRTIAGPLSPCEKFLSTPSSPVVIHPSTGQYSAVGVSVVSFPALSHGRNSTAHNSRVRVQFPSSAGTKNLLTTKIVVQNIAPIQYVTDSPVNGSVLCSSTQNTSYDVLVNCSAGSRMSVHCDGTYSRVYYTCPQTKIIPRCSYWDYGQKKYVPDTNCVVESFTPYNTTCECIVRASSSSGRRLTADVRKSSDGSIVVTEDVTTYTYKLYSILTSHKVIDLESLFDARLAYNWVRTFLLLF